MTFEERLARSERRFSVRGRHPISVASKQNQQAILTVAGYLSTGMAVTIAKAKIANVNLTTRLGGGEITTGKPGDGDGVGDEKCFQAPLSVKTRFPTPYPSPLPSPALSSRSVGSISTSGSPAETQGSSRRLTAALPKVILQEREREQGRDSNDKNEEKNKEKNKDELLKGSEVNGDKEILHGNVREDPKRGSIIASPFSKSSKVHPAVDAQTTTTTPLLLA